MSSITLDPLEISQFSRVADQWWDVDGPFRPLHALNPTRLGFIRTTICQHFGRDNQSLTPFQGLRGLDLGCGGGLVSEPMARMGATMMGADADARAIDIARDHAAQSGLAIDYRVALAEKLVAEGVQTDIVLALEIIEHVADQAAFLAAVSALVAPEGVLILSTLNRTPKGFFLGIVAAEYLVRWVPRGTHHWQKFMKPSELAAGLRPLGFSAFDVKGLIYNPISRQFQLSKNDLAVNYLFAARRF
jgi:2-polyprenyl-6-hydroxyphenyl methylase/3-demethylubiquinone-9 3-methyltransferase